MPINYTIGWNASRLDSNDSREFGLIATVVATGSTVLTPANVYSGTEQTTGAPFPQLNQPSTTVDPRYFVQSISAPRFDGPHYAEVAISYRLGKGSGEQEEEDPLSVPLKYRVRNGVSGEVTDADVNGKPLLNTAGDPFSGTVSTSLSALYVDVVRNESTYDLQQAYNITNKINSDNFALAGFSIRPGEAYCLAIEPEREYKLADTYVPVVYSFELRPLRKLANGQLETQFIHRIMDKGRRAWIFDAQKVDIFHGPDDGQTISPVSDDVLLDEGKPKDQDQYVSDAANFDPEAGRGWADPPKNLAPKAVRDKDDETGATFLLYQKYFEASFAQLGLA